MGANYSRKVRRRVVASLLVLAVVTVIGFSRPHSLPTEPAETRFQKLSVEGHTLASWSGPWACVHDRDSGLVWEVKTDDGGVHDGEWSYSWYQSQSVSLPSTSTSTSTSTSAFGVAGRGDCGFKSRGCDTQDLISISNQMQHCGFSNWRLPTLAEWQSIFLPPISDGYPKLRRDLFLNVKAGDYWSANQTKKLPTAYAHLGEGAISVNVFSLQQLRLPYRNAAFVMLVADVPPASTP
ncbi:DUF1566 domain-containing protein [Thaumasiovibrio subtropicus]|uniref:Lcl domain-containing protein n=1 Tax=Thaumasiovibrio subtropicus TaxID=1891207 RepID=UPI00131CD921|nr:DUF1566 domain-containing protein [Thaumasiovibrio subtropicus]